MWATNLADIARSTGYRVVEQPGWRTRGVRALSGVRSIIAHHTAGAASGDAPSLGVVQNGRAGLSGPLAQFVLGRSGTIYVVAAGACNHAGVTVNDSTYGNSYSIGIEAENTGVGQAWPEAQVDAYARLCAALCRAFGLPTSRIQGHKEICSPRGRKSDPAYLPGDMNGLRIRAQQYLTSGMGGGGSTQPADPPKKTTRKVYTVQLPASTNFRGEIFALPGVPCRISYTPGRNADGSWAPLDLAGIELHTDYTDDSIGYLRAYTNDPNAAYHTITLPQKFSLSGGAADALSGYITYRSSQPISLEIFIL